MILGPLHPTVGGITTLIEGILSSNLTKQYQILTFDTQRPTYGRFKQTWDYTLLVKIGPSSLIKSLIWTSAHLLKFPLVLIRRNPQIVHINTVGYWVFWENAIYAVIAKLFRKKVILHTHGGGFENFYNDSNFIFKFLIRQTFKISDKIFVLSPIWRNFFEKLSPREKIFISENFVDTIISNEPMLNRNLNEEFTVLFVGGQGAKLKGLFDVIKAAEIVKKKTDKVAFILVACSGINGIESLCQRKGLTSTVKILGYLKNNSLAKVFAQSDIFILPSYAEGSPITMLEAMSAGLPVIASFAGSIPDIIQEGNNGFLINAGDYNMLAQKILDLKADSETRNQMARNNIKTIQERYLKDIVLNKLGIEYNGL
jgi:glycosyltransferase involved in cell wall biosynthesis